MAINRKALLLTLLLPFLAQGQEDPEARLEAAKHVLIDQALSQPTRVRSAAWIDGNGVLHEQTRFTSDAPVQGAGIRGIRVPAYLPARPEPVTPAEPIQTPEEAALAELEALEETGACSAYPGLAQSAVLRIERLTPANAPASGYAWAYEQAVERLLLRRFEGEPGWRLAPARDAQTQRTPYERAVYDSPRNRRPLELTVALAVRRATAAPRWWNVAARATEPLREQIGPFRQKKPTLTLDLELRLGVPGDPTFLWVGYESLMLGLRQSDLSPEVQPRDIAKIYGALNQWFSALEERQRCAAPRFAVQGRFRGQLIVNGGAQAGLKPGDKLLLADGLRTSADVLNDGVDSTLALAEVRWVEEEEAGLTLLSGSEPKALANWVAVPL